MEYKKKNQDEINKKYNINIYKFMLKVVIFGLIIIISIPIILEYLICRNKFVSVLSNSEWSGFLGGFLGSLIGAIIASIVTIYGIRLTIEHNTEIVMEDRLIQNLKEDNKEIKLNRPFMYVIYKGEGGGLQNIGLLGDNLEKILRYSLELVNIGMNAAVNVRANINYCDFNCSIIKRNLFSNKKIIQKDEIFQFELGIPRDGNKHIMIIKFQDLLENNYEQEISFEFKDSKINIFSSTPVIKDKEYNIHQE